MSERHLINIHAIIPSSRVNGPGSRMVVFFQGCARGCGGCFNPETHSFEEKELVGVERIFETAPSGLEGITVSGGEPFMQPDGLLLLLKRARSRALTTVVYTGFTIEELRAGERLFREALDQIDVLVDGPFVVEMKEATLLARGSTNQRFHFLTRRYRIEDFLMPGKAEVIIGRDGAVTGTGFSQILAFK